MVQLFFLPPGLLAIFQSLCHPGAYLLALALALQLGAHEPALLLGLAGMCVPPWWMRQP